VKAILLIDHGSRRGEANEMLGCMAALVQHMAGDGVIVQYAHMEIAEPSIARGVDACVASGATEIIAFPYMLSPGRHSTSDIPAMVAEAARPHPGVTVRVTAAFGVEAGLGEIILRRAAIPAVATLDADDRCRCWQADGRPGTCGAACPALAAEASSASAPSRTIASPGANSQRIGRSA
jgi:sirohydrochlorin ferrochelatase